MNKQRQFSAIDKLISHIDQGIKNAIGAAPTAARQNPSNGIDEHALTPFERDRSIRLMRINHAGEVAAQALYHGQSLTARLDDVKESMQHAAEEENDHLAWCAERVAELGGQTSHLQPFWYAGSFVVGATAGLIGDKWSLGFVAETERQVVEHLSTHQAELPAHDKRSHAIVAQMKKDEAEHGEAALEAGGTVYPQPVRDAMATTSKLMTTLAWWV